MIKTTFNIRIRYPLSLVKFILIVFLLSFHSVLIYFSGERVDFVLEASNKPKPYRVLVESNCTRTIGLAKLLYNSTLPGKEPLQIFPQTQAIKTTKVLLL